MTSSVSSRAVLNQVILTGKVADNPQLRHQPDGTPVLQFPLELNDSGNSSPKTDPQGDRHVGKPVGLYRSLIQIVAFGQLARSRAELRSGQHLFVKGRLHQRQWKTPEGRTRTRVEVIASELHPSEENQSKL